MNIVSMSIKPVMVIGLVPPYSSLQLSTTGVLSSRPFSGQQDPHLADISPCLQEDGIIADYQASNPRFYQGGSVLPDKSMSLSLFG